MTRAGWVLSALVLAGCASQTPETKLKNDFEVMKNESTPERLRMRGEASASVGDMTRAEQYFVAAMRSGGDAKVLTQRLLAVCVADQRYPVALVYAEEYLRRHPEDIEVRYAAASIYAATGEHGKARDNYERVVVRRPELAEAHYALASLIHKDGDDPMRADQHFREYLRLEPQGPYAESARASLLKTVPTQ